MFEINDIVEVVRNIIGSPVDNYLIGKIGKVCDIFDNNYYTISFDDLPDNMDFAEKELKLVKRHE